jgi:hypothetical protein
MISWHTRVTISPRFERIPMWAYLVMMNCWLYRRGKIMGTVTVAASLSPWKIEAENRILLDIF